MTPKDEAFDELARRQGGGFQAKRQMAADKLKPALVWPANKTFSHLSDCAVHNGPAYPAGPCDCGATQPWNEDEWRRNNWRCGHGWLRGEQCEICNAAQPAQAPTALQGLSAYLRCEAGGEFVGSPNHETLMQWAREVDAARAQPAQERNFCSRCGKRTADLTVIHTCTPPQGDT